MKHLPALISVVLLSSPAYSADAIGLHPARSLQTKEAVERVSVSTIKGPVVVMDGRTLWFPTFAQLVRLADIDACELPQWAFDYGAKEGKATRAATPVPCGPFAKAWLKRTIGSAPITCKVVSYDGDAVARARCSARGRDVALEMLRVGWARVDGVNPTDPQYTSYQRTAMSARYGMWATYVLDINEWRRKSVDKSLNRQPITDFNLLVERSSENSAPPRHVR